MEQCAAPALMTRIRMGIILPDPDLDRHPRPTDVGPDKNTDYEIQKLFIRVKICPYMYTVGSGFRSASGCRRSATLNWMIFQLAEAAQITITPQASTVNMVLNRLRGIAYLQSGGDLMSAEPVAERNCRHTRLASMLSVWIWTWSFRWHLVEAGKNTLECRLLWVRSLCHSLFGNIKGPCHAMYTKKSV